MKLVKITEEANAYTTDVITNESTNTTINKEDKEMSNNNTTKNVNANVNETKEEKTMTTANNTNIFAAFNQAQVELEEKFNESFAADAQAARGFATKAFFGTNSQFAMNANNTFFDNIHTHATTSIFVAVFSGRQA